MLTILFGAAFSLGYAAGTYVGKEFAWHIAKKRNTKQVEDIWTILNNIDKIGREEA